MQSLLVPVLAQLVTLATGASTEARYVASELDQRMESYSSAGVSLGLRMPHLSLNATYWPSVTVSPLERTPRQVTVTDTFNGTATADYGFRFKRGSLRLSQSATYTLENPYLQALNASAPVPDAPATVPLAGDAAGAGAPAPTEQTSTNPASDARQSVNYRAQFWTLRSSARYDSAVARQAVFSAEANYQLTAGLGRARADYPLVQGPDGTFELAYRVSARGTLTSTLGAQYGWSEVGAKGFISGLAERYAYQFTRRTRGELGAGVAYSFSQFRNGPRTHSIYPVGSGSLDHLSRLYGGSLTLGARATTAPVLDVTTARVDPRLGFSLYSNWTRRRLSLTADANAAISMESGPFALRTVSANFTAGYDLGAGFRANSGVRLAWQTYGEQAEPVIPVSTAVFVGLSWGFGTQFGRAPQQR